MLRKKGNKMRTSQNTLCSLKLINGGPTKFWGVGKNRKINNGEGCLFGARK